MGMKVVGDTNDAEETMEARLFAGNPAMTVGASSNFFSREIKAGSTMAGYGAVAQPEVPRPAHPGQPEQVRSRKFHDALSVGERFLTTST
jgi:hypothetical protein